MLDCRAIVNHRLNLCSRQAAIAHVGRCKVADTAIARTLFLHSGFPYSAHLHIGCCCRGRCQCRRSGSNRSCAGDSNHRCASGGRGRQVFVFHGSWFLCSGHHDR